MMDNVRSNDRLVAYIADAPTLDGVLRARLLGTSLLATSQVTGRLAHALACCRGVEAGLRVDKVEGRRSG